MQKTFLKQFSQIEITIEADDNADASTPGEVVYSSVFPPQALVPVRRLLVAFDDATNQSSLIYGLWWSAEGVRISAVALSTAYQANDEAQVRKMNEEILNQIVGDGKIGQYKDWNGDGAVDLPEENLGDPYGLLPNGSAVPQLASRLKKDAASPWGTYHYCGSGVTSWYGLARHVLETLVSRGRIASFRLLPITTAEYPTPARRPPYSVLDCRQIEAAFGIRRPTWRQSVEQTVDRLLSAADRVG